MRLRALVNQLDSCFGVMSHLLVNMAFSCSSSQNDVTDTHTNGHTHSHTHTNTTAAPNPYVFRRVRVVKMFGGQNPLLQNRHRLLRQLGLALHACCGAAAAELGAPLLHAPQWLHFACAVRSLAVTVPVGVAVGFRVGVSIVSAFTAVAVAVACFFTTRIVMANRRLWAGSRLRLGSGHKDLNDTAPQHTQNLPA